MDTDLIEALENIKIGGQEHLAIRKLLDLPRYTPEQIILFCRREVLEYLRALEDVTFSEELVASIKAVLRMPATTPEEAQSMSAELQSLVERFIEDDLGLKDLNPMFTYRWYLSLMTEENYISVVNTMSHINQKFVQSRSTWVHQQVNAVQIELKEDYAAEKEFEDQTRDFEFVNPTLIES